MSTHISIVDAYTASLISSPRIVGGVYSIAPAPAAVPVDVPAEVVAEVADEAPADETPAEAPAEAPADEVVGAPANVEDKTPTEDAETKVVRGRKAAAEPAATDNVETK